MASLVSFFCFFFLVEAGWLGGEVRRHHDYRLKDLLVPSTDSIQLERKRQTASLVSFFFFCFFLWRQDGLGVRLGGRMAWE